MSENQTKLPWWTWVVPILVMHLGTEISLEFKYEQGVADLYLPTAFSIIMINWWGPVRILPAMYLNALLSTGLWGIQDAFQWPIYALPETVLTFGSWLLFTKISKGQYWMPDVKSLALFIAWGMFVPIIVEVLFLESLLVSFHEHPISDFWRFVVRNSLGEFASNFGLALPLLYYATPFMQRSGLLIHPPEEELRKHSFLQPNTKIAELGAVYLTLLFLTALIPFEKFWFLYGLVSMYTALRFGFGVATVTNYFIFVLTYFMPKLSRGSIGWPDIGDENVINIFLGMLLLYIFAAITGRVISDLKKVEIKLQRKNTELGQTNSELDRFVYSVSHDLSAPLKSIRGLINVSRIDNETKKESYLNHIEASVLKLEAFISEILDYSRNNRLWQKPEKVNLKELCVEILDNLKFIDGFQRINIVLEDLEHGTVTTDKPRLKIILNNLLSNAIKFHRKLGEGQVITVSANSAPDLLTIKVEDNGQGIRPEYQHRIFEMFFRANETEKGSGLGLYIAKEAAEKIGGTVRVESEYGKGSVFTVEIPIFD
ncbi:MAG TPA: HAMP domain-containing sensor histidine kinase [Cyclobacteriaceae bacterium]|jgi:signal transduction histidine kinase|nr:HAMP domain-containing sensor histidine kinase [Cyclobacteriaceae bacterium]